MTRLMPIAGLLCLLAACSVAPRGPVSFNLAVSAAWFSPQAPLTVQVYSQTQLATIQQNPGCVISSQGDLPATGLSCPPGMTPPAITPEVFEFTVAQAGARLEFATTGVRAGERFRLVVSGLGLDGCKTIIGSLEWLAESEVITVEPDDMSWQIIENNCPPTQ